jgi:hypothetical protein
MKDLERRLGIDDFDRAVGVGRGLMKDASAMERRDGLWTSFRSQAPSQHLIHVVFELIVLQCIIDW